MITVSRFTDIILIAGLLIVTSFTGVTGDYGRSRNAVGIFMNSECNYFITFNGPLSKFLHIA